MDLKADLHVHLGSSDGLPVKIGASPALTLEAIIDAAASTGMDVLGVVDCQARGPWAEISRLVASGHLSEEPGGGFSAAGVLLIPGAEIQCRGVHLLCYMPDRDGLAWLARMYEERVANPTLSTGTLRMEPAHLKREIEAAGGVLVPAHVFTPHRGLYGRGLSLGMLFGHDLPQLVELGLSADTVIAGRVAELDRIGFVSSSDAHSLPVIGREHSIIRCRRPDFRSVLDGLRGRYGCVLEHRGLDPRLGKYHRTACPRCGWRATLEPPPVLSCAACGSTQVAAGVLDTATGLSGASTRPPPRPVYRYQVPLDWLPGVGPATRRRLVERFGDQWTVIHTTPVPDIERAAGRRLARQVDLLRRGAVGVDPGGGGRYGRLMFDPPTA